MYRFFVEPYQIADNQIFVEGSDYNHIKNVLRMKIGEEVSVAVSGDDKEYRCGIEDYEEDRAVLKIRFVKENNVELPCKITLLQCLPKADKMELIIQKAVELGVFEIIPVSSKRAVVKLDDKKALSKISRWNGVSMAAAKQAKRAIIPEVKMPMSVNEALEYCNEADIKIIPYELSDNEGMDDTRQLFESIEPGQSVVIFIGPEGGFEDTEVDRAKDKGFKAVTLGKRILRTETAGMTVLSWLVYLLER